MNYKKMQTQDIVDWCVANNQVDWLKATINKTFPAPTEKDAKAVRKITFFELKLAFVRKFMPEIEPKAKPKAPTMYDIINSL